MKTLAILCFVAAVIAASLGTPAHADDEPTAAEVTGAPAPSAESGRVDTIDESDSAGRLVLRGALFVPRAAVTVVFAPIEGLAWLIERYQIIEHGKQLFWNDAGTFGVFPTFQVDAFGLNVGLRAVHLDLLGANEGFDLRISGGGRYEERYVLGLHSGELFGKRVRLELGGEFEKRPDDPFYGFGNVDDAMETNYRHRIVRATSALDVRAGGPMHLRTAGAIADHDLDMIDDYRTAYGELELRYDTRRRGVDHEPRPVISKGLLLAGFVGRSEALDNGSADFYRYGVDIQQFFRLGPGPRVLSFRTHGEAVTGDLDEVPLTEMPRLGGKTYLRGYPTHRFRDRVALVSSVEYMWDLSLNTAATLFVDSGRVHESIEGFETSDMRVGYGLELQLHTTKSFLARASIASSIDGGVFLNFALDPVFELDGRVDRR